MNVLGCYVPDYTLIIAGMLVVLVIAATWNETRKW